MCDDESMTRAVLVTALLGCGGGGGLELGAEIDVDGSLVLFDVASAVQVGSFTLLHGEQLGGDVIEISFRSAAPLGEHTCDESPAGLLTIEYTTGGVLFSTNHPVAAPTFECTLVLDATSAVAGDEVGVSEVSATVATSDGATVHVLGAGRFAAVLGD
jgi:hypothetical protein